MDYRTVQIPMDIYAQMESQLAVAGFATVSDYVTYILRSVLLDLHTKIAYTPQEEAQVLEMLRSLGYVE